ncbi:MAG: transporter, partial [Planctomycetes bacterium]|nr:transporter [Planctomycetota bacterium]
MHTLSADTLAAGAWQTSLRFDWIEFEPFSDSKLLGFANQGVDAHSMDRGLSARIGLVYGATENVSVGLDLPYISNQGMREGETSGGPTTVMDMGDAEGLGDLSLFAKWRCWTNEDARAALYAGAELPTGADDVKDDDGMRMEAHHQPGSGSFDPFLGAAYTMDFGGKRFGASLLYTLAGDGSQDSNLGDLLRANVGWSWRVSGADEGAKSERLLECNAQWHERRTEDDVDDANSGGVQVFLSPGYRVRTDSGWSWFASVGVPVLQNLYGEQVDVTFRTS